MTYCLKCFAPNNPENAKFCQTCGSQLLLQERYRAIKSIGQGGFGRTFQAVDEAMPRKPICVIKQFAPQGPGDIQKALALFEDEAVRLFDLGKHNCIPTLFAHCTQDDRQYIVQEFVAGQNLAQELTEQGPFSSAKILDLLQSLLPVLDFIHTNGVIHRDIKPENIIRRSPNELVLVDFGAAKHATGTAMLRTGTSIGSAEYVAPEQSRGKAVLASDLYSLGVTCIHLLTGISPFELMDLDGAWIWRDYVRDNSVSERLGQVLDKLILPSVSQRYKSATEVLRDLDEQISSANSPVLDMPEIPNSQRRYFIPADRNLNPNEKMRAAAPRNIVTNVPLPKQASAQEERAASYDCLENLLSEKRWQEADEITRMLILQAAGGLPYLDNGTVLRVPSSAINTIDRLWTTHSNGRFGFTAQKQIFDSVNQDGTEFVVKVGWRGKAKGIFAGFTWKEYPNMIFMLGAPAGHLPVLIAGAAGGVATEEAGRVLYNAFNTPGVLKHFFTHVERCWLER